MSTHAVRVVKIDEVLPHDNAENLEIIPIGGWQVVCRKGQFKSGDAAIYIQPDYVVPTNSPEFSFLAKSGKTQHRLKSVRLRGALSFGLLIPVPDSLSSVNVGDDVMSKLGIERYEPPVMVANADVLLYSEWPAVEARKFDLESLQNYMTVLNEGETVIVTEKIHGANSRWLFDNGTFYMGSRTRWLKPDVAHSWKRASDSDPRIRAWCEAHPGVVLYGEIFGSVQSLKYGCKPGEVKFVAFAANDHGKWLDTLSLIDDDSIPTAPFLYRGPWNSVDILPLAEMDSAIEGAPVGHMREGLVIVPEYERIDPTIGRVALKYISNRYWESSN